MKCELCKINSPNPNMYITLRDINGTIRANVCQPCLKKLKDAVKSDKPQRIEIYPVKEK